MELTRDAVEYHAAPGPDEKPLAAAGAQGGV
jgi:hypothetical protein